MSQKVVHEFYADLPRLKMFNEVDFMARSIAMHSTLCSLMSYDYGTSELVKCGQQTVGLVWEDK